MKEKTALDMWKALERSYQTKSLPNQIYMKQRFYCFKMEENKSLDENMDVFLKLVSDLASVQVNISEEDQAIFLLNSLPKAYEQMAHSLKYGKGKDTITVEEVTESAYSKEVELKEAGQLNKAKTASEGLYLGQRGRSDRRSNSGYTKGRSKSRGKS